MEVKEYSRGCNAVKEWERQVRDEGKNYLAMELCGNCRVSLYFEVPKGKEVDDYIVKVGMNIKCPNCGCLALKDIVEANSGLA